MADLIHEIRERRILPSVNYALAIWSEADEEYRYFRDARELASEIQATL